MKLKNIASWMLMMPILCFLGVFASCSDDESSSLAAVTNISYEPTLGGAVITFTAPHDNNLLYVKASYTNSLNQEVSRVTSIYGNTIEIDGLTDDTKDYPVTLTAVDKKGGESPMTVINVRPGRSYINVVADSVKVLPWVGAMKVKWVNPVGQEGNNVGKTIYVVLTYTDSAKVSHVRYLGSRASNDQKLVRGLIPGHYTYSYHVEDFDGNKTAETTPQEIYVPEEVVIPKYVEDAQMNRTYYWKLVPSLTTLKEVYENKNSAIFDGIVDNKDKADDNSYAGTNADQYGGSALPWDTDQMDIVFDLNQTVNVSRIRAWQRAHFYGWSEYAQDWRTDGTSYDYNYYEPDNLKRFKVYGSMDMKNWFLIQDCDIASNSDAGRLPVFGTNEESWNGHTGVWMPTKQSYQYALDGHHWQLDNMSPDTRYIRIRFVENWDMSNRTVSGMSEFTLYGGIVKTYAETQKGSLAKRH